MPWWLRPPAPPLLWLTISRCGVTRPSTLGSAAAALNAWIQPQTRLQINSEIRNRVRLVTLASSFSELARRLCCCELQEMDGALKLAWRIVRVILGLLAVFFLAIGASKNGQRLLHAGEWNEFMTVTSVCTLFFLAFPLYGVARRVLPSMPSTTVISYALRALWVAVYIMQVAGLIAYLTMHNDKLNYLFLIPDIALALLIFRTKATAFFATLYVLILCVKMMILWPALTTANFNSPNNPLGPNGLKVLLLLTIPNVQFPVLTARVGKGTDLFDAYTQNMAAVFTHTMHVMDTIDMYFILLQPQGDDFSVDVQYMLLMFSVMGAVACNLYHVLLFFDMDDGTDGAAGAVRLRRLGDVAALSGREGTKDERLLHYLLWLLFFVDLPYLAVRLIAFLVHGTQISVFLAKNFMMITASTILVINHSHST